MYLHFLLDIDPTLLNAKTRATATQKNVQDVCCSAWRLSCECNSRLQYRLHANNLKASENFSFVCPVNGFVVCVPVHIQLSKYRDKHANKFSSQFLFLLLLLHFIYRYLFIYLF